jgi:threonine/homoserine/homoserine lactone efflux protein
LFGVLLSFLIGPVFFILLETSIKKGARHAILIDIGVLLSDVLYLLTAYFFAETITEKLAEHSYVKYIGAAVFITIGLISILKKSSPQKGKSIDVEALDVGENDIPKSFSPLKIPIMRKRTILSLIGKGIGLNAINPAVLVYWIAACTYATQQLHIPDSKLIYYFSATLGTMFSIDLLKIYFASKLKNRLTPKTLNLISIVVGLILVFAGIMLCFQDLTVVTD